MARPAHRKLAAGGQLNPRSRAVFIVAAVAVVVVIAGGVTAYAVSGHGSPHGTSTAAGGGGGGGGGASTTSSTIPPLVVTSITPAASATGVQELAPISVTFNEAVSAKSTMPTITPPIAGAWAVSGDTMTFKPAGGYVPDTGYHVTVPPTVTTVPVHKKSATLASAFQSSFTVTDGSELRLEQMLAELNYLPVQFIGTAPSDVPASTSTTSAASSTTAPAAAGAASSTTAPATTATAPAPTATATSTLAAESTNPAAVLTVPEAGNLTWRWANTPSTLQALWTPGTRSVIDQGAIMAFENAHGMKMDGLAGPQVWGALIQAIAVRQITPQAYDYLVASKAEPESLTVYQNGAQVYSSPANTGVAAAPTQSGTWPVYERAPVTTMTGKNPDGSTYNDPGIPWVAYFHGGDAVHGFNRGSYGVPQSVGCVELPESNAAVVYNYDPYGTLVTVTG